MTYRKTYEQIPVSKLHVDPTLDSQRIFQPQWASKLSKMWDPELLTVATVSRRPEGDFLIDGQHSTLVALEREGPDFERDCIVYHGLSKKMESKLFLAVNRDRKPVKPFDNFRVGVAAEDPIAVQVALEVTAVGLDVSNGTSTNRVGAVQALIALAELRPRMVTRCLEVSEAAWGRESSTWDNMMLRALGMVLHINWDKVNDTRLSKILAKAPVNRWKLAAVSSSTSGGGSSSRSKPLAYNIVEAYNSRLGPERILTQL